MHSSKLIIFASVGITPTMNLNRWPILNSPIQTTNVLGESFTIRNRSSRNWDRFIQIESCLSGANI